MQHIIIICLISFLLGLFIFGRKKRVSKLDKEVSINMDLVNWEIENSRNETKQRMEDIKMYMQYASQRMRQDGDEELRKKMLALFPDDWKYKIRKFEVMDMRGSGVYMIYDSKTAKYSGNTTKQLEEEYQKNKLSKNPKQ